MEHSFSNEEMRLAELLHQFLALSDDQECAGRIIFRGPKGEYIGEAALSPRDIEAATDALTSVTAYRADMEEAGLKPEAPLPRVDTADVTAMVTALENFANGDA
jgi:hypothetical protein